MECLNNLINDYELWHAMLAFSLIARGTGCGPKYRGAWGQPLTRGPEADETKTVAVTLPHRV